MSDEYSEMNAANERDYYEAKIVNLKRELAETKAAVSWRDKRIEALEAIVCGGDYIEQAGWWGSFASHLCTEKNKLASELVRVGCFEQENERLQKQVEEYESKKLLMDQFEIINTIRADERRKTVESVIGSIWDMEPYPARSDVIEHIRREFIEGK